MAATLTSSFCGTSLRLPTSQLNDSKRVPFKGVVRASSEDPLASTRRGLATSAIALVAANFLGTPAIAEDMACEMKAGPEGLSYCDLRVGTGRIARPGGLVKVHYIGRVKSTGEVYYSTYSFNRPVVFSLNKVQQIRGFDYALAGGEGMAPMQAGGKRKIYVPSDLGYGPDGARCRPNEQAIQEKTGGGNCGVPPNAELEIELEYLPF
eukprot:jgi/Mesvir1/27165/Mv20828-RA.1